MRAASSNTGPASILSFSTAAFTSGCIIAWSLSSQEPYLSSNRNRRAPATDRSYVVLHPRSLDADRPDGWTGASRSNHMTSRPRVRHQAGPQRVMLFLRVGLLGRLLITVWPLLKVAIDRGSAAELSPRGLDQRTFRSTPPAYGTLCVFRFQPSR